MANIKFAGTTCKVTLSHYFNYNTRMSLYDTEDGMPVATVSVNVPEILEKNEMVINEYSKAPGLYAALLAANMIHPQHRVEQIGEEACPVCFINKSFRF